jgi:hypothetical protein
MTRHANQKEALTSHRSIDLRGRPPHAQAVEVVFEPGPTSHQDILEFLVQIRRPDLINLQAKSGLAVPGHVALKGPCPPGPAGPGSSPDRGLRVMMAHCGFFGAGPR